MSDMVQKKKEKIHKGYPPPPPPLKKVKCILVYI